MSAVWGICNDPSLYERGLYGLVIAYQLQDPGTAKIVQPACGITVGTADIRPLETAPLFQYGDAVSPAAHSETAGTVRAVYWHHRRQTFFYLLTVNGKKISRRYFADELTACGKE